jgi:asparagine synthetase B (glutamine-hydrolysing)
MCGFLFVRTKKPVPQQSLDIATRFVRHRGPDKSGQLSFQDRNGKSVVLAHYLLDISGSSICQPLSDAGDDGQILLFNGEIYNFHSFSDQTVDSLSLLPAFKAKGGDLGNVLDGEFAIVIYDRSTATLDLLTDPFLTKPMYLGRGSDPTDFGVASYPSTLSALGLSNVVMAQPNTHYRIRFGEDTIEISERFPVRRFSLSQTEPTFARWTESFVESVRKRASHGAHEPMLCLSSGYDTGAIALALNLLNIPYRTFTIPAGENEEILRARVRINAAACREHVEIPALDKPTRRRIAEEIQESVEPYVYAHDDGQSRALALTDDFGSLGTYAISQVAKARGVNVSLSGCGADEIISDYGHGGRKIYFHSEFGGAFPQRLEGFFPWKKFYGDTLRSYLFKDEIIMGRHGIEGRYPFLDAQVAQEFLSLQPELKNSEYKAPIAHFLREHNYPFEPNRKRGFSPLADPWTRKLKNKVRSWSRGVIDK